MGKGTKWSSAEDVQLARSWVHVTEDDSVKGEDASNDTFWANVHAHWTAGGSSARTQQAIKNRWSILNRLSHKFADCVDQVQSRCAERKTDDECIQDAHALHVSLEHEAFLYEKTWQALRGCRKWRYGKASHSKLPSGQESSDANREQADANNERDDDESSDDQEDVATEMPKRDKRKADTEPSLMRAVENLARAHNVHNDLFADYMLLQLALQTHTVEDANILGQLKAKYVKRFRNASSSESSDNVNI
ncbi:hypothetical protein SDRG_03410 [Saprolegnia diclina VS20]|uniref:No apical meristem-associated C-terminal domain-containing protein n=1 Tax=Saprolegnia diclina (strain VS20) TaxID=1156394 RepID=T0QYP5_SAPDV|nr:hypothetical protein SDRG_03410 [Saprolegnia diclina VS20]EQC39205.1 hypothetical protein SDRG_03410 [Saprolegnia diclina VS20]|eukprot:XP_008607266.1 hypothetical protein SDRG_03410 [Saprolegnia diclina VS20]